MSENLPFLAKDWQKFWKRTKRAKKIEKIMLKLWKKGPLSVDCCAKWRQNGCEIWGKKGSLLTGRWYWLTYGSAPLRIVLVELNRYYCTLNNVVHFTLSIHENYFHLDLGLLFNPIIHWCWHECNLQNEGFHNVFNKASILGNWHSLSRFMS